MLHLWCRVLPGRVPLEFPQVFACFGFTETAVIFLIKSNHHPTVLRFYRAPFRHFTHRVRIGWFCVETLAREPLLSFVFSLPHRPFWGFFCSCGRNWTCAAPSSRLAEPRSAERPAICEDGHFFVGSHFSTFTTLSSSLSVPFLFGRPLMFFSCCHVLSVWISFPNKSRP